MAIESVRQHVGAMKISQDRKELLPVLINLHAALVAITAKLDADAGVTDTNYAALLATYLRD